MPLYAYICKDCGERFDLLIGVTSEKEDPKCRKCNSRNIEKTWGAFSVGRADNKLGSSGPSCPTGTCPTCF